ncbi:hypothetical protein [Rhodococcus chondri]|uniref:Lipoprotein n=1 Tax=Rhodococcus chondri TaxID=3065941 RepID=A0ABU7JWU4_9NOCA|nr:hypothetical protein [Rhodococcus sp. CC-R104]MEE2034493.1 hypothetical protein [Rhodococcus sp. CC-R104]
MRNRLWRAAVVAVAVVAAGCSGVPGGAEGDLSRAADTAASSAEAVRMGLALDVGQRTTRNHAATLVSDSLEEVLTAHGTVATLETATASEAAHRDALLAHLDEVITVFGRTREHVYNVPGAPDAATLDGALGDLADTLERFGEGER